ncbi:histidine kinase [Brevibacillus fluminis]|uniref:Signal transduction histidine-protein kinase/phosphatase DegS n=1 Tax=Brevibacillus fluminis TaxID=511487 RepID=A0A3M8DWV1_9BACL|nr:sensor histidine kinase [Brevibacillus fluminis]RNB92660.1 histidine kinase [Brevibacillus fluminis]
MSQKVDVNLLDGVFKKTVKTVEASRKQIFEISENARRESGTMKLDIMEIRNEIGKVIDRVDKLELAYRKAKSRLAQVSRHFHSYTEEDIRVAYEEAHNIQIELTVSREREANLRRRRDELERRLRSLEETIVKAENLMSHIGVVLNYLTGDLSKVGEALETAKHHQMLGLRIIQAQEEERKRVSREIHDGPAQSMANVVLRTEIVERMLKNDRMVEAQMELHELKDMVRFSLSDVRRIIFDLRPMALDDLGLIPTIQKYCQTFEERTNLHINVAVFGKEQHLDSSVKAALFRLIQECLNNTFKHARAIKVQVKVEFQYEQVIIVVKDDGVGFVVSEKSSDGESFGILGMKERTQLLEGTMEIHSQPGQGTRVQFHIPIKR